MRFADILTALETEAKEKFSEPYRLALDDRPFKPDDQVTVFIRHSVVFGEGERTALGTGFYRYVGIQYLAIMFRTGSGNASLYKQADLIATHYTDKLLAADDLKVVFGVVSTIKLPQDANGFSQLQVVCPFYFDSRS